VLTVKLGEVVAAGEVVARLDDRELRQQLELARSQQRTAEAQIVQAQVDARGAEVVSRREHAAEILGVSSQAEAATARQTLAKATAALGYMRASAEERTTRIAQLRAHLQDMTLVAPIAGRVAMIYVHDGARVEEGHPVLRVISSGVLVKFAIPAEQAGTVQPGDAMDVRIDHRAPIPATVAHVAPELDGVAQLILADAELVDPPADLQPGTVCRIAARTPGAATRGAAPPAQARP
jgi:HlyD family secretion protein